MSKATTSKTVRITEGKVNKGGNNPQPSTQRPPVVPQGQGGTQKGASATPIKGEGKK